MSEKSIQKIMDETIFSMWVEGFVLPDEEKITLRKVLSGEIPFVVQLENYIQNARLASSATNV